MEFTPKTDAAVRQNLTREEWLEERKNHLGASDCAKILTGQAMEVYAAKVLDCVDDDNDWMSFGRDVEGAIAKAYAHKTGRTEEDLGATTFVYHPDIPWLAATLDRVTIIPPYGFSPLELKHVGTWDNADEWRDDPPTKYQVQLQIQMACYGAQCGSLAGMFPGYKLVWTDLLRDNDFFDAAYPILQEFWGHVQRKEPPDPNSYKDLDAVKRIWKRDDGSTVTLGNDTLALADEWEQAKKRRKEAEKEVKTIEAKLRASVKDATYGALNDGSFLTLKTTKVKAYTKVMEASEYRALRRTKKRK